MTKADGFEWRLSVKYDPSQPRVPAGSSQGGQWTSGGSHEGLPSRLENEMDGGAGPSIQWHGTSNRASTFDSPSEVYLTTTRHEAEGYARDLHRMGLPPAGGAKRREMFGLRRKPGPVRSIADQVDEAIFEDYDVDEVIAREAERARTDGFRYLYFSHPSFGLGPIDANFGQEGVQDVFISLYPKEDLTRVQRWTVK